MIEYNGLGKQFDEIGKSFQGINNIPHLVIGKDKTDKPMKKTYIRCPYCNNTIQLTVPNPIYEAKQEINKLDREIKNINIVQWGIYICLAVVVGYAVYRLIWG